MKNNLKNITLFILALAFLTSCNNDDVERLESLENLDDELITEREILKETSFIVGKILQNPDAKSEVIEKMKILNKEDFNISLHALMEHYDRLPVEEHKKIGEFQNKSNNHFKNLFIEEIAENSDLYPNLKSLRESQSSDEHSKSSRSNDLYINAGIYVPYLEVNDDVNDLEKDFLTTYDPLTFQRQHVAYEFDRSGERIKEIEIDFDYVESHPVVGIVPLDPCDYDHNNCGDMEASEFDFTGEILEWEGSGNTQNQSYLMVTNENHTDFNDEDFLVSTEFTAFRSKSSAWMRMFDRRLRLRFYVARAEKITVNNDGTVTPGPHSEHLASSSIRRRRANRDDRWYEAGSALDYDWSLRKVDQTVVVLTQHSIASNASVSFEGKIGVKIDSGEVEPVGSAIVSVNIPISRSNSKFRASKKITRNAAFDYNVGTGPLPADKCHNHEGHCYFINEMHHTSFILRHYLTPKN